MGYNGYIGYNDIFVDFTQAGLGELSLLVEGPRR